MPRLNIGWTFTLAASLLLPSIASAQGITSSGLFGNRSIGGGTIQAGSRNAFGGGDNLIGGTPGTRLQQLDTSTDLSGSERFIRGSRTAADFVGSDVADTAFVGALPASPTGSTGGFSGGGFGTGGFGGSGFGGSGFGAGGFGGNGNAGRNQSNTNTSNRQINFQTKLQIGFEYPAPSQPSIATNLQRRLNSVRLRRVTPLTVEMNGQTAILRGQLARDTDRVLAVRIAKLEPGVESVVDQLTVGKRAADASERSPSN